MPSAMTDKPKSLPRLIVEPTIAASSEFLTDFAYEGLVDLQAIEWKLLQIGEARVSGAEVVEGDADPKLLNSIERFGARPGHPRAGYSQ